MRKKLVVALATSLILANGTSVALASGGSGDSSTTSTTIPRTRNNSNLTASQRAAPRSQNEAIARYKAELHKYLESLRSINTANKRAMVNAQRSFKVAREAATTDQARLAAAQTFKVAVITATETKIAALRALGEPPAKPAKP